MTIIKIIYLIGKNHWKSVWVMEICKLRHDGNNEFDRYAIEYYFDIMYDACKSSVYIVKTINALNLIFSFVCETKIFHEKHHDKKVSNLNVK